MFIYIIVHNYWHQHTPSRYAFVFPHAAHRADELLFDWETDEFTVIYVRLVATSSTFQTRSLPDNIITTITV